MDLEPLRVNEIERKTFFINLYNIQMIHALVAQENLPQKPTEVQVRIQGFFFKNFTKNVSTFLVILGDF